MLFLPALSGILIGTSFIPFPPWASLFCFVPLWIYWAGRINYRKVFLGGWLCSFVLTLIGFNWVAFTLHEFAHLPWPFAMLGLLLFAALAHLYIPIAGLLWLFLQRRFRYRKAPAICLMGLITAFGDRYSLTLFDWNFGYSWYASRLPLYQCAEWLGFSGLSTLTIGLNILSYFAWESRRSKRALWLIAGMCVLFVTLNAMGYWIQQRIASPDASINVLLVQGSVGNEEKMAAELGRGFRNSIIERYFRLSEEGLEATSTKPVNLIVWPEAAFPALLDSVYGSQEQFGALRQFVAENKIPLVTGAYGVDRMHKKITNSLFALDEFGNLTETHYSKTILLAFGEYIPGIDWFPFLRDWLPPIGEFARGPGPTVLLRVKDYKIGPQICYESLFPEFSRGLANLGAQFIVNVTNDSWYGSWQEPYQHLYMTLARAVEYRRPVIRATNTGISSVALASGEVLHRSPLDREWSGVYRVPYLKQAAETFYQRYAWFVPGLLWGLLVGFFVVGCFRNDKVKRDSTMFPE